MTVSSEVQEDALLDFLIPTAKARLEEFGVFAPFGAALSMTSEMKYFRGADDAEIPPGEDPFSYVQEQARESHSAVDLVVAAFAANVFMDLAPRRYSGHIGVHVERPNGNAKLFMVPYLRRESRKFWLFGGTEQVLSYKPMTIQVVPRAFLWY